MNPETEMQTASPCRAMWTIVTPDLAARWLGGNEGNRNLRSAAVGRYAKDMTLGLWAPSNDAICIDPAGRLLNGQHRLSAVIQSGASVGMFVITGMPPESFAHMDRGAGRTYADALRSQNEGNAAQLSATLTRAASFALGVNPKTGQWSSDVFGISDSDRTAYLSAHPEIRYSVDMWATHAARKAIKPAGTPTLALGHHLIARAAGHVWADRFAHQIVTTDCEPAVSTVRSILVGFERCRGKSGHDLSLIILLAGWNNWAAGREVSAIRPNTDRSALPKIAARVTR